MSDWRNGYSVWQVKQLCRHKWSYLEVVGVEIPIGATYFNVHYTYLNSSDMFQVYEYDLKEYWSTPDYLMIGSV